MELLFKTITGSRLYGMDTPTSDTDIKGFGFPALDEIMGLKEWEQTNSKDIEANSETVIFSVQKFIRLCASGNPTVLEVAFADPKFHLHRTIGGDVMCYFVRETCITENVYHAYTSYIDSQIRKLQRPNRNGKRQALIDAHGYDTKFAGHAMRLCIQAHGAFTTGTITPTLDKAALDLVMPIKRGELKLEETLSLLISSRADLEKAWNTSIIKGRMPDMEKINRVLTNFQMSHFAGMPSELAELIDKKVGAE